MTLYEACAVNLQDIKILVTQQIAVYLMLNENNKNSIDNYIMTVK